MNIKSNTMKSLVLAAGLLTAGAAHGATILGVTYSYDTPVTYGITGKDAPDGTPQALTDGIGQSGVYTPTNYFWEPGGEGTIYGLAVVTGTIPQPGVTFDLGGVFDLANVNIHYGVRQGSGINAPVSITVAVDGVPVGSIFGGFDNSANAATFGDIRSNVIDLTGQTGQLVTLDFLGNSDGSFTGLTEVEFSPVPEPGCSALLLGLGSLCLLLRRRV